jgi:hypothetical protein
MLDHIATVQAFYSDDDPSLADGVPYHGVVARQVMTLGADVLVTIGDVDESKSLIPCKMGVSPATLASGQVVLPTIGDPVVVVVSSEGDHWITAWTPL